MEYHRINRKKTTCSQRKKEIVETGYRSFLSVHIHIPNPELNPEHKNREEEHAWAARVSTTFLFSTKKTLFGWCSTLFNNVKTLKM
jgi:hypothetical protein